MSESLLAALAGVRTHLEPAIAEAQIELADVRARCRELRERATIAEVAGSAPARPAPTAPQSVAEQTGIQASPDTTFASSTVAVASPMRRRPNMPRLPRRWRLALGAVARLDLERLPGLLARNIILRWEGGSAISGTHLGHAKAIAFVRQFQPLVDTASLRVDDVHADGSNVEIAAVVKLRAASHADVELDVRLTVVARFDPAGMITLLFATPDDPAAVDAFLDAAFANNSRSA